jgi:hypothetical protein
VAGQVKVTELQECIMLPSSQAVDNPIRIVDEVDIPVFVHHVDGGNPFTPQRRPYPSRVESAATPWPGRGVPSVSGDYLVGTTWREILLAAVMVGRDPTPWFDRLPQLARLEILARVTPLRAYLSRVTAPGRSGAVVKVNDVYVRGTERSAKAAFGYRIGMTMAE